MPWAAGEQAHEIGALEVAHDDIVTKLLLQCAGTIVPLAPREMILDALTAAMGRYLDDSALLARRAACARTAFAKFDMTKCAEAYVDIYRSVGSS